MEGGEILKDFCTGFQKFLQSAFMEEDGITPTLDVVIGAPNDKVAPPEPGLLLFLYRICHNPFLRNDETVEFDATFQVASRKPPALHLDLHFLLIPYAAKLEDAHLHLGTAMAHIHSSPFLPDDSLSDGLKDIISATDLRPRLVPEDLDLDDLNKLWASYSDGMRLCVGYELGICRIDPHVAKEIPTVHDRVKVGLVADADEVAKNRAGGGA